MMDNIDYLQMNISTHLNKPPKIGDKVYFVDLEGTKRYMFIKNFIYKNSNIYDLKGYSLDEYRDIKIQQIINEEM
jgi:hypothetical protein